MMTWTELHKLDKITPDMLTEKQIPYYVVASAMDRNTVVILLSGILDDAVDIEEIKQLDCTTKIAEKLEELYDFSISAKTTAIVKLLHEDDDD